MKANTQDQPDCGSESSSSSKDNERRALLKRQFDQIAAQEKRAGELGLPDRAKIASELVVSLLDNGEVLSNLCFNLKHNASLSAEIRLALDEAQNRWDVARRPITNELRRQLGLPPI